MLKMAGRRGMNKVQVRESEIEDVFAAYPEILGHLLDWKFDLSLVARQKDVPSGRLDLLYVSRNELFLVELKVQPFEKLFLDQLLGYKGDLIELQSNNGLVKGNINAILLVTEFDPADERLCHDKGVLLKSYQPDKVLELFYSRMAGLSNFLTVRPIDLGVWHVHVINRALYALPEHNTIEKISDMLGIARNTVRNHLRFASLLGLVSRFEDKYLLTDLGRTYLECRDHSLSDFMLSDQQTEVLREHIVRDPFGSNIIFGIYSLVEAIFTLARNSYPVRIQEVIHYYKESVGKRYDWATERSAFLGAHAFSNFAIELGLVARAGDKLLLTPAGFRFILMLQLHKGIKIVDSLGLRIDKHIREPEIKQIQQSRLLEFKERYEHSVLVGESGEKRGGG